MSDDVKGLGQRLLRRAAAPGMIRHDLAARRSFHGGAWLASEIHRRYAPDASFWGHGPGLPYPGFGFGTAGVSLTVETGGEPMRVSRKLASWPGALTPSPSPNRTPGPPGEGGKERANLFATPRDDQKRSGDEGAFSRGVTTLPSPGGPGVRLGEGSGVRAEGRGAFQTELQGHPQPALLPPAVEIGPAIVRRATARPHPPGPPLPSTSPRPGEGGKLPLREGGGAPLPAEGRPMGEGTGVRSGGATTAVEIGPAIVHRAAGRGSIQRASLPTTSPGPVQAQRSASPRSAIAAAEPPLPLPLARPAQPGNVIQRQPSENLSDVTSPPAAAPGGASSLAEDEAEASDGTIAAAGLDVEDVVDRVMRRLTRTLAVESERHGGRRWS